MRFHRFDPQGTVADIAAYCKYLEANRARLPQGIREFALSDWFHDRKDSRCLHDAWLESFTIRELSSGERHEARSVEIAARFLGAFHDGFIELTYEGVTAYSISAITGGSDGPLCGHGDCIMDEISVETRDILHEAVFSGGGRWSVRCSDIHYQWLPK